MFSRFLPLAWGLVVVLVVACGDDSSSGDGSGGSGTEDAGKGGSGGSGGSGSTGGTSASGTGGSGGKGGSGGSGGSGGGGGSGGSGGDGPTCNGITGTYAITRTRSKKNPGSCPPDYDFNPSLPGKVAADSKSPSGFKFEIGYSNKDNEITFQECTNNVAECSIFATCKNGTSSLVDQVNLEVAANSIGGTIARIVKDEGDCTVNFDLSGTRQ